MRADVEDNLRKTITQLFAWFATRFAGVIALAAAVVARLQLDQFAHALEHAAADAIFGDQAEEPLDLVEPEAEVGVKCM